MAEWINVNKELPESGKVVLVTGAHAGPRAITKSVFMAFYARKHTVEGYWIENYQCYFEGCEEDEDMHYLEEGWYHLADVDDVWDKEYRKVADVVTHWMPLPAPV